MTTESINALGKASSAYLRSAMHQPVQWREWGEDAFAAAQKDDKPILLDIGAVWCHWCHVMDRESYDDPEIAKIINDNFIAVKVDRDERPDIDSRYQAAVSAVSGQGEWPLTGFLTSDGKPFYGGTYFPPGEQHGRPSFRRVLLSIATAYREKRDDAVEQAEKVVSAISRAESLSGQAADFSPAVITAIVESALEAYDARNGGFGHAPKFPHPAALDLLIDHAGRHQDERAKELYVNTLERMARGGVYDQLAGGFHRYSVDERWVVPHFEKMAYDNSELLKNYVHAYQATGTAFFADVAKDIIRWMDEWLSDREFGGFYASQDADDSMDDDGDYFTWTRDEARAVLDAQEADVACLHYDIHEIGEMHHNPAKNVLYQRASAEEIAKRLNLEIPKIAELLASAKKKMYAARLLRRTPYVDKTVYTGWNGLCVTSYLEAAKALPLTSAKEFALRSLDRVLAAALTPDGELLHVIAYSDPKAEHREVIGLLEDYAFLSGACLDAYEATGQLSYFTAAQTLADAMIGKFFDPVGGGFFDSEIPASALGVLGTRRKPFQDSPTPAGNSAAAIVLCRLHSFTRDVSYRDKAEQTLELLAAVAGRYGIFAGTYGVAAVHLAYPATQVVIVGEKEPRVGHLAAELLAAATSGYAINRSIVQLEKEKFSANSLPPALSETVPNLPGLVAGAALAQVCTGFTCQPPTSDPEALRNLL
jgi:uncharacterized protein YyaL (SSP411 family)